MYMYMYVWKLVFSPIIIKTYEKKNIIGPNLKWTNWANFDEQGFSSENLLTGLYLHIWIFLDFSQCTLRAFQQSPNFEKTILPHFSDFTHLANVPRVQLTLSKIEIIYVFFPAIYRLKLLVYESWNDISISSAWETIMLVPKIKFSAQATETYTGNP